MVTRSNVKLGLTGAILLIIVGSFSACGDLPTAANDGPDQLADCIRIEGMTHCPPTQAAM